MGAKWSISDVATGPNDETYVLGRFGAGNIDFGGSSPLFNPVDSGDDAFLAKLAVDGSLVWQHSWGDDFTYEPAHYWPNDWNSISHC